MTKNKRLKIVLGVLALNFITFWFGIYKEVSPSELGIGLAALNAPLFAYILGETKRPSKQKEDEK